MHKNNEAIFWIYWKVTKVRIKEIYNMVPFCVRNECIVTYFCNEKQMEAETNVIVRRQW